MKMVTSCPACGTGFRVHPDQLTARSGQVRCGQCGTVFDARATLVTEAGAPEAAPPAPRSARHTEEISLVEAVVSQPVTRSLPPEPEISVSDGEPEFEFGPRARTRSRLATASWVLACAAAAAILAGQAAHAYRGELALAWPETRPLLAAACRALGCTIPLPQHADLISLESSELAAERGVPGVLTLSAVLRNRAGFAQALPSLELTLTDGQDRALARRVLAPADYLGARAAREPVFAAGSEAAFRLHIDAAGLGASGYRLYVFYR
jgi:predicted Zn finger-like uncharacterized protein